MRFSYTAVWEDTVRLLRSHASLAAALAGVFMFLPGLLVAHFLPTPQAADAQDMFRLIGEHFTENLHWMLLSGIAGMAGTLAILCLIFRGPSITVGAAIGAALGLLPFYFIANLISAVPIMIGVLLFVVPGLYLLGRLLPVAPVMVAENLRNPLAAVGRTWALTKGKGWAILGLFLLVFIAGFVLSSVIGGIIALIFRLALSDSLSAFMGLIVSTLASTILQLVLTFLYAGIYRALAGSAGAVTASVPPHAGSGPTTGI
jgi:hypothetical protein